jgi:hypothetical protein
MTMNKPTMKTMSVNSLKVNYELNIRQQNNYDLPSIVQQIRDAGRILKPIIVRGEDNVVLSGNRRTLGGQQLFNDPECPVELHEQLSKTQVIVYTGLTPEEELTLILDHGGEKPISKTEVLEAVWRLDKQFYPEGKIISWMYHALADYTDNKRKLMELPSEPKAREAKLKEWFHGTVGNYMLASLKMGPFVREQMVLTHLAEDKLLKEGQSVTMRCSRKRITELSAAKSEDTRNKEWDVQTGGPKFNELIEKFKAEDAGDPVVKTKRPSVKELTDKADVFKSKAIKDTLLTAAGNTDAGLKLSALDDDLFRIDCIMGYAAKYYSTVKSPEVKALLGLLLKDTKSDTHGAAVEEFLKTV